MALVFCGENPSNYDINMIGGKGKNLLDLFNSQHGMPYFVPPFFIIPSNDTARAKLVLDRNACYLNFREGHEIRTAYESLSKPLAVRSSSPLEDGIKASFAGMFKSVIGVESFQEFKEVALIVRDSAISDDVSEYAREMGMKYDILMPIIVQEKSLCDRFIGTAQIEDDAVTLQFIDSQTFRKTVDTISFEQLERMKNFHDIKRIPGKKLDYFSEGDGYFLANAALLAKQNLGLDGVVQVEFCYDQTKLDFVQIRKLPEKEKGNVNCDLSVPKEAIFVESNCCNGIAGELVLPAYYTFSQSSFFKILVETGQGYLLNGVKNPGDDRAERFERESKIPDNNEYQYMLSNMLQFGKYANEDLLDACNRVWKAGNSLFPEYILVCDKLDETIAGMASLTKNKRAIITMEKDKTSHAMTVARDLGIICMGVDHDWYDLSPRFFHELETGDFVHVKSDGKNAVTYIEKKRDSDPYIRFK